MELRPLGRTGVQVTSLCLGAMTFGNEADEAASAAIVDRYLDAGGNFVDTADVYTRGVSEEITGRALGNRRHRVVLATKGRMAMSDDDPNLRGASRRHLIAAAEASLRRLGTDWIDLYQVHWPDYTVTQEETLAALDHLVTTGKVRYVGVSNYLGSHLAEAVTLCRANGWAPVVSLQQQHSLVSREIEPEILPFCRRHDVAVLPFSPLGGGVLSGKYRPGAPPPEGVRLSTAFQIARRLTERNLAIAAEVARVAEAEGRTSSQVAINWVLHRPGVTSPIVGARTVAQLDDDLGAEGWQLAPEHVRALDEVSAVPPQYPHDMYAVLDIRP